MSRVSGFDGVDPGGNNLGQGGQRGRHANQQGHTAIYIYNSTSRRSCLDGDSRTRVYADGSRIVGIGMPSPEDKGVVRRLGQCSLQCDTSLTSTSEFVSCTQYVKRRISGQMQSCQIGEKVHGFAHWLDSRGIY